MDVSDLSAVAMYGNGHPNTGQINRLDVLGELYVGHTGLWCFRRLEGGGPVVRLRSGSATFADEVKAGLALTGWIAEASPSVDAILGKGWHKHEVDVPAGVVRDLAATVERLPVTCVLASMTGDSEIYVAEEWQRSAWSVMSMMPSDGMLRSQWGDEPVRPTAGA